MSEVQAHLSQVTNRLGYPSLTDHQRKAVAEFVSGHDVLVVLPTSSGKSVCFASFLWLFDALRGTSKSSICRGSGTSEFTNDGPSTKKSLSLVFVNAASVQNDPDLNRKVSEGMYQLVYIGPEMLIGQQIYRDILLNPVY